MLWLEIINIDMLWLEIINSAKLNNSTIPYKTIPNKTLYKTIPNYSDAEWLSGGQQLNLAEILISKRRENKLYDKNDEELIEVGKGG